MRTLTVSLRQQVAMSSFPVLSYPILSRPMPAVQGTTKRGFEVGEMSELKDQAKRGGVRLPGRHSVKTAHRCIYTDPTYDMKALLKPKNVIRVQGEQSARCSWVVLARNSHAAWDARVVG